MVNLDKVSLADIIPGSLASSVQVQSAISGIDPELRLVSGAVGEVLLLARIDELPEGVIDLLAWQYHCDFYDDLLSLEQKRNLVRDSILWHRKKGTKWAVLKVLENLGVKAEVTEWFETGAAPYTFNVAVTFPNDPNKTFNFMDSEVEQLIRDAINEAKPVHADIFSLTAKDETRDPDHICFWDVCNYEHGVFGILTQGPDCEVEYTKPGEILHVGVEHEHSDAMSILRYLAFDVSYRDYLPPSTGAITECIATHWFKYEHSSYEVDVTSKAFPNTMAVYDEASYDGVQVTEPTIETGGWSGKFDAGARFDDSSYQKRDRQMVTKFQTDSPTIEIFLRDFGLMPTVNVAAIHNEHLIAIENVGESEISILQLWEVQETWRTRKVWSMRSWRNNLNAPDITENTFPSEILDVALTSAAIVEVERQPVARFDTTVFDGEAPKFLPNCLTVSKEPA